MPLSRRTLGDVALAAVVLVVAVVGTLGAEHASGADTAMDARGYALLVPAAAVLVIRRWSPLLTLGVTTALTTAYLLLEYPYGPILLAFAVAVYTVARHLPLVPAATASLVALLVLLTHLLTNDAALPGALGLVPGSAWAVVPFAIGVTTRVTRESAARARAEAVRQRVDDERLRVAQEVHDVVGHGLAAIKMQADVALHVLSQRPEQAGTALQAISKTSTEALTELRATLGLVRQGATEATRSPTPGLRQLDELRQRMGSAGVRVDLEETGSGEDLSPAVDLASYRVVQESLTNVLRHSGSSLATVRIAHQADAVLITVSNRLEATAPSPSPSPDGMGISGMRQRVTALGGELTAGPTTDGRFEVRARLPKGARP